MPVTPNPPSNYIVTEDYLDTVITSNNTSDTAAARKLPVADSNGHIDVNFIGVNIAPLPQTSGLNLKGAITEINYSNLDSFTLPNTGTLFFYYLTSIDSAGNHVCYSDVKENGFVINFSSTAVALLGFLWRLA